VEFSFNKYISEEDIYLRQYDSGAGPAFSVSTNIVFTSSTKAPSTLRYSVAMCRMANSVAVGRRHPGIWGYIFITGVGILAVWVVLSRGVS
jgi:hypothetical protein